MFYLPFLLRVSIALLTQTFFQPDEYFQSLEPAHRAVFGYGHLTWEWTINQPIRSPFYPSLFIPLYWLLKVTKLDGTFLLISAPKILQAVIAALTDIYVAKLAKRVLGNQYAKPALFLSLASFFNVLALSRTLSNSIETSLTTIALSYWPLDSALVDSRTFRTSLMFAALACMVRPTNALIWIFLWFDLYRRLFTYPHRLRQSTEDIFDIGWKAVLSLVVIDSLYFRKLTITPLNFLRANASSISLFYGQNPWHYYLTQALPILLTTALPFFLRGAYFTRQTSAPPALKRCLSLISWTIAVYSLAGHKEWRFLHPLLPIMHVIAAYGLVEPDQQRTEQNRPLSIPIRSTHQFVILMSIPASLYVIFLHGRAQISVMHELRTKATNNEIHSLGFLMPCHSTPWQAYLHQPQLEGKMWALGCEPPLGGQDLKTYRDQAGVFYDGPLSYILTRFPSTVDPTFPPSPYPSTPAGKVVSDNPWSHTWPSHLVLFGDLLKSEGVREVLEAKGYREVWAGRNGWEEDEKRRGGVRIWRVL